MARINVEDDLETYPPFRNLLRLLQRLHPTLSADDIADMARGKVVRLWRIAQKHWGNEMELIPRKTIEREDLGIMLDAEMVDARKTGIYARGSETQFDWYLQKCRASAAAKRAREEKNRKDDPGRPEIGFRTTGTEIPEDRKSVSGLPEIETRTTGTEIPEDRNPISESPSCSTPAPALAPAPPPIPTLTNPDPPEPESIPEADPPPSSRGQDEILAAKIVSALRWEGENLSAAMKKLPERSVKLIAAYGGARTYSEGLRIAWRACRRKGFGGDLVGWDDDKAQETLEEFRRIGRRLRTGGSSEGE